MNTGTLREVLPTDLNGGGPRAETLLVRLRRRDTNSEGIVLQKYTSHHEKTYDLQWRAAHILKRFERFDGRRK